MHYKNQTYNEPKRYCKTFEVEASNDQISSYAGIFSPSHYDLIRCEVYCTRSISNERTAADFSKEPTFFAASNQKMMDKVVCEPRWALDLIKKFGVFGKTRSGENSST